ncbi:hypothetical protein SynBOUM118_02610 [Synechococcus sp. BOUM118]|nr:hypothetical protein SynBOUM118_02610 [Synechococcus sp. BOUM118]
MHQLALSSKFMREVTFDFESEFMSSLRKTNNHIFIAGLARSGTTILLNALHKSNIFASLSYADMPFVLAPNLWSKISINRNRLEVKERAHGDGIKVSIESPEAFEEVFWKTFADYSEEELEDKFRIYTENIMHRYKKNRYLSKNNQNIRRLGLISSIFNYSNIFVPFRDPIQHSYSLLTQHKKFIRHSKYDHFMSKYMKWIGHTEFGPNYSPIHRNNLNYNNDLDINHWIEQWLITYKSAFRLLTTNNNIHFICYEKLCSSKDYWLQIQKIAQINETYDFEFKISKKEISLDIDENLRDNALSLYNKLSCLHLK